MHIRQAARPADDGYASSLAPGLRRAADARRLAEELGFSAGRLSELATAPPGLYADVAREPEAEEALWLAFLIAYIGPGRGEDPFAAIRSARVSWAGGELPDLQTAEPGPRGAHEPGAGPATLTAYRAWAQRAGSQAAAFTGEPGWAPRRRFERAFERLALPRLHRGARFDLLVTLGRLGRIDAAADSLHVGGDDPVTTAAKRVFGIGDPRLLDRRAAELAEACEVPLEALDLALYNFGADPGAERFAAGTTPEAADPAATMRAASALGLPAPG